MNFASPFDSATLVIAAVSVVLPWSTCPIVPTFTCGFVRSNFALAMISSLAFHFRNDLFGFRFRHFLVVAELHRVDGAALAHRADRKSTRLNSSHRCISYAVFCLKKKN